MQFINLTGSPLTIECEGGKHTFQPSEQVAYVKAAPAQNTRRTETLEDALLQIFGPPNSKVEGLPESQGTDPVYIVTGDVASALMAEQNYRGDIAVAGKDGIWNPMDPGAGSNLNCLVLTNLS